MTTISHEVIEEMMRRKLWLVFLMVWIIPAFAEAGKIRGLGLASCTKWAQDRKEALVTGVASAELWGETQWMLGFISGFNVSTDPDLNISRQSTGDAILNYIDIYCKENPSKKLSDASESLLISLTLNADNENRK